MVQVRPDIRWSTTGACHCDTFTSYIAPFILPGSTYTILNIWTEYQTFAIQNPVVRLRLIVVGMR